MAPFTCPYIKRDGTVCGNKCWLPEGCYRHWKLYEKNLKKKPCLFSGCEFPTDAKSGFCHDHSASIHSHKYRMRQKAKAEAEALQPRIPKTPISESDDSSASIREHLFPASSQLFADSLGRNLTDSIQVKILGDMVVIKGSAPEPPRIYEAPVSESDDENMGLDLFGD
ncbi:hypothetical protein RhiirC2_720097 [Rhizophagus irregularis]|uniref:Uncharacterized protein n=1 Tax=Rhizophagus irregularis TaxID=588596 RepID=A0A2N1MBM3_9GLOM|nr:hypothetical protein RhiirC2_720097 [Rhizophagus irregularis]